MGANPDRLTSVAGFLLNTSSGGNSDAAPVIEYGRFEQRVIIQKQTSTNASLDKGEWTVAREAPARDRPVPKAPSLSLLGSKP